MMSDEAPDTVRSQPHTIRIPVVPDRAHEIAHALRCSYVVNVAVSSRALVVETLTPELASVLRGFVCGYVFARWGDYLE
jgi:hypothetical protein